MHCMNSSVGILSYDQQTKEQHHHQQQQHTDGYILWRFFVVDKKANAPDLVDL